MKLSTFLIAILVLLPYFLTRTDAPAVTQLSPEHTDGQDQSTTDNTLQMAFSEVVGSNDRTYHFRVSGTGYAATNAAHNLSIDISVDTVTISIDDDYWQLSSQEPATDFTLDDNHLTLHRDRYDEWYINGPVGLQQGFTLYQPSEIAFNVGGTLSTTASNQTLHIGDTITFSGLMAYDANNETVPVAFELHDQDLVYAYNDIGAAYPLTIDPWIKQWQLAEPDGYSGNGFGWAVAVDGDTAVLGIPGDECAAGSDCGSAYVFVRNGITWTPEARLTASDAYIGDNFGKGVALDGDTAYIGAPDHGCCGKTYVFVRNSGVWTQQGTLVGDDIASRDFLGNTVALQGDTAVASAHGHNCLSTYDCGSVYVFVRNNGIWTQQAKLEASDGGREHFFGWDMDIDGDTIVVGAPYADCYLQYDCGSAYVFTRTGTTWNFEAKLGPIDGRREDKVGYAVAVEGDVALMTAPGVDCAAGDDCGLALIFRRTGATWTEEDRFSPYGIPGFYRFGYSAELENGYAVIGVRPLQCLPGSDCSLVFIYRKVGAQWWQESVLPSSFGLGPHEPDTLSVSGSTILVGNETESAYVFVRDTPPIASLTASAECVDENLAVTVSLGDGLFYVTSSGGSDMPRDGIKIGTTVFNGPDKWDDVIVGEASGDLETINLGQFKCRTDERPVPLWPPHLYRTTNPQGYFQWSPISDANDYRVFLFDDANAATRTVDIRQNSGGATYLLLSTPLPNGRLFWRVRGRQNQVWSLWSIRFMLFKDPVAPVSVSTPIPTVELEPPSSDNPVPTIGPVPTFPPPPNSR